MEYLLQIGILDTPASSLELQAKTILFRHMASITDTISIEGFYDHSKRRYQYSAWFRTTARDGSYAISWDNPEDALVRLEAELGDPLVSEENTLSAAQIAGIVNTIHGCGGQILAPQDRVCDLLLACFKEGIPARFEVHWKLDLMGDNDRLWADVEVQSIQGWVQYDQSFVQS